MLLSLSWLLVFITSHLSCMSVVLRWFVYTLTKTFLLGRKQTN